MSNLQMDSEEDVDQSQYDGTYYQQKAAKDANADVSMSDEDSSYDSEDSQRLEEPLAV